MQLAYVFLGYFLGSMLFGYRITWLLKGVDIRKLAEDEIRERIMHLCLADSGAGF